LFARLRTVQRQELSLTHTILSALSLAHRQALLTSGYIVIFFREPGMHSRAVRGLY
jgi:hypothetical protein